MMGIGKAGPVGLAPDATAPDPSAWADLATRALEPNIFNDPAFAMPATLHLAGRRRPRLLTARDPRDPRRLIGLCCVAATVPGLPLSAWLHPQATAAFPLLDAARCEVALVDLLNQARGLMRPAGLLLHGLPAEGATMRLIEALAPGCHGLIEERGRAVVGGTPPPPLAGKAGKEFRRQARRLAEVGRVAFDVSAAPADLEAFLRMEARGWKGRGGTAIADASGVARFTRAMVTALTLEGRGRVHRLTLDGRPIAMGLVLRSGPNAFYWKTTYDESFARFSPGAHLTAAIGGDQAGDPMVEMTDSCAVPGHSMIDRLWPERMAVRDLVVAPAPGLTGSHHLAMRAERARRAARAWIKQVVTARRQGGRATIGP